MSDEEYEYDYGSDAEYDYGSDQEATNDVADELVEIENSYFEAEDIRSENSARAIELFEKVVTLEEGRGAQVKWRFKAMQNLVVLYFGANLFPSMIKRYKDMLLLMVSVTRNDCTDAINVILDAIASATNNDVLSEMYEITLEALKNANNDRLWFNTNLKLAKVYLDAQKIADVERVLALLKKFCQHPDGTDDMSKGTALLELYCIEVQLCSLTRNAARLRGIYPKTMNISAAVSDPRIIGIIREEGGKMLMSEGCYDEAYLELYEAFRSYQEAGNIRAKACLKYVVIASMLCVKSDINPFAAREAKVYVDDKEILVMQDLRASLERNDLNKFERIIGNKANKLSSDPFIMTYISPLRHRLRELAIIKMIQPYQKVSYQYIANELHLTVAEVESFLINLIIDQNIQGAINQAGQYITLKSTGSNKMVALSKALSKWSLQLSQ